MRKKSAKADTGPAEADILVTMTDEIEEAVELLRPHFPADKLASLRDRARSWRSHRYQEACWPDFAQIARDEAAELAALNQAEW
jgi:hypothetical protein